MTWVFAFGNALESNCTSNKRTIKVIVELLSRKLAKQNYNAEVDAGQRRMEMYLYNYNAELPRFQDMLLQILVVYWCNGKLQNKMALFHKNINIPHLIWGGQQVVQQPTTEC